MKFPTIVVDPPWPIKLIKGRPCPYPTLPLTELAALDIPGVCEPEGYVFLWGVDQFLREAFDVMDAWRLVHRQTWVWAKPPTNGPGGFCASTVEYVFVAQRIGPRSNGRKRWRRADAPRPDTSWFAWPRGAHSQKPEEMQDLVEALGPVGQPRLELFARRSRPGWVCLGNEIDGRDIRDALSEVIAS